MLVNLLLFFDSPFMGCLVFVNPLCLAGSTICSRPHSFVYALSCPAHVRLTTLLWFSNIDFALLLAALSSFNRPAASWLGFWLPTYFLHLLGCRSSKGTMRGKLSGIKRYLERIHRGQT